MAEAAMQSGVTGGQMDFAAKNPGSNGSSPQVFNEQTAVTTQPDLGMMPEAVSNVSAPDDAATYGVNMAEVKPQQSQPVNMQSGHTQPNNTQPADDVSTKAVTSAKAAINAMYAKQASQPQTTELVPSARAAVNAAASQATTRDYRSAANLHHGSIQRSMESTRTSASALLKMAKSTPKAPQSIKNSTDPLAKPVEYTGNNSAHSGSKHEIPVVRTSLKLGAAARPKRNPVILPPNSRMARHATSVDRPSSRGSTSSMSKLAQLLSKNNAAKLTPKTLGSSVNRALGSGTTTSGAVSAGRGAMSGDVTTRGLSMSGVSKAVRPQGQVRDPQMLGGGAARPARVLADERTVSAASGKQAPTSQIAEADLDTMVAVHTGASPAANKRFRTAPRGYATARAAAVPADKSYVMTTPPKLSAKKSPTPPPELGKIEPYRPSSVPSPIGDHTPIGRIAAREYGAGHGGAAPSEYGTIKADNKSNYSFSKNAEAGDPSRYTLGGQSPFLKSVNVEKRPLSSNAKSSETFAGLPALADANPTKAAKSGKAKPAKAPKAPKTPKASRKNRYSKDSYAQTTPGLNAANYSAPSRPTVIIPSSRRSKVPLFFLILLTIILGAAVGAASYLCFFQ